MRSCASSPPGRSRRPSPQRRSPPRTTTPPAGPWSWSCARRATKRTGRGGQFDAAEPENRLVVDTLERRWNGALEHVVDLEQRLAALSATVSRPSAEDRQRLLALAADLPAVWRDATTDARLKKRIVRLVIEEIVAEVTGDPPTITLLIHWKGGKHTQLVIRKNRTGHHRYRTDRAIIDVVRDLARSLPDEQIARILNRLGYRQATETPGRSHA